MFLQSNGTQSHIIPNLIIRIMFMSFIIHIHNIIIRSVSLHRNRYRINRCKYMLMTCICSHLNLT